MVVSHSKLFALAIVAVTALQLVAATTAPPDDRCISTADCQDPSTPNQCCAFKHATGSTGVKLFTCMEKTNGAKLGYQCVDSSNTYCDYCAVGFYCCEYQTNLIPNLISSCQSNITVLTIPNSTITPNPNLTQQYYRCVNKTSGADLTSGSVFLSLMVQSGLKVTVLGILALYSF